MAAWLRRRDRFRSDQPNAANRASLQYVFGHGRQNEFVLDECVEIGFVRGERAVLGA